MPRGPSKHAASDPENMLSKLQKHIAKPNETHCGTPKPPKGCHDETEKNLHGRAKNHIFWTLLEGSEGTLRPLGGPLLGSFP